uniref:Uncharacterized protein n=1 Tax=Arundo donax TaxID=35708 RepID=A0A0A9ABU0_ARUDO
MRFPLSSRK